MSYNAKVTSKGQITLPAEMRKTLKLQPGDRISFSRDADGRYFVEAKTGSLADLRGIVKLGPKVKIDIEGWINEARGARGANVVVAGKRSR